MKRIGSTFYNVLKQNGWLLTGWLLISGVWIGCLLDVPVVVVLWLAAERNSLRDGEDGWDGETFPSLSLEVDDGGVGGNVNPAKHFQNLMCNSNVISNLIHVYCFMCIIIKFIKL